MSLEVDSSAFKHGVQRDDAIHAWRVWISESVLVDDPRKVLRVGFDRSAHVLEVIGVLRGDQTRIIHAMPVRQQYLPVRKGRRR